MNLGEGLSRHELSRETLDQALRKIPRNSPGENAPPGYYPGLSIKAGSSYPLFNLKPFCHPEQSEGSRIYESITHKSASREA
jgi:hypothetical protein